ncbi:hypothetical protein TNCV_265581 [Trichonephila clavipes]|nr:hypothetical protein TNCV_265581 [Trichonephila clavipes]
MKDKILDVHFPKQKNRRVIFQCGDRARLTSEHVVLLTAILPLRFGQKLDKKNCMKNMRVVRPVEWFTLLYCLTLCRPSQEFRCHQICRICYVGGMKVRSNLSKEEDSTRITLSGEFRLITEKNTDPFL